MTPSLQSTRRARRASRFFRPLTLRPRVELLEDRTLLDFNPWGTSFTADRVRPDGDPRLRGILNSAAVREKYGPFNYEEFRLRELQGRVPDTSGPVNWDPAALNALVNNNSGASGTNGFTQSETSLVAFGNTVVVGFNDSGSLGGGATNQFTGFARSTDGGATFTDGGALPTSAGGDAGDPVLARHEASGRLYFATLGFSTPTIQVFRSDDNGATWLAPVNGTPGGASEDKEWLTVDNFAGAGNGNVYLISRNFGAGNGIYLYRSTDGGATFGPNGGTQIAAAGGSNVQGAFVAVGPDHSVYAFYFDQRAAPQRVRMRRSTDFGATFGPEVTVATLATTGTNGDLGLTGIRNGLTTSFPIRSNAFPHVAVNPVNGHLYATYGDNPAGADRADVYFTMSADNGATWSAPARVNNDATTTDQWQPTIAASTDGSRVGVFYYSRQEDAAANNLFKFYGAIGSVSGPAVTFAQHFAISDVASLPEMGRDDFIVADYMGDYDQAVATPGFFHVVWSDSRNTLPGGAGRLNPDVFYKRIPLGLVVTGSVPANGATVATTPASYVITLTDPVDPGSVQSSDLLVNGLAATGVAYTPGTTTMTFTFAVDPVTAQGPQTIHIDQGAFNRASDNQALIVAYDATFRYDVTPLAVTSTVPPTSGVFTLPPPLTLVVNFNEPIAPGSVGTGDLTLNVGTVTGAVASGPSQATYTISGITAEGTLNVTLLAGAVTDTFTNPNPAAFTASYVLDFGTVPYPTPLVAKAPLGSLIYDPSVSGFINPAGDTDSFTLSVDPNQLISVAVVPPTGSGLRPTVTLLDPSNAVIATATAAAPGAPAVIQTAPTVGAATGTYTVRVEGAAGTTGAYGAQVTLNAALEGEGFGGPTNDTLATAQPLAPSGISLGGTATRYAALGGVGNVAPLAAADFEGGTLPASFTTFTSDAARGRIVVEPPAFPDFYTGNTSAFALHMDNGADDGVNVLNEAILTVDLTGVTQALLSFKMVSYGDEFTSMPLTFSGHANGDGVAISADGTNWRRVFNQAGSFTWQTFTIDLVAEAAAGGIPLGPNFKIKFQQFDNFAIDLDGRGFDDIRLAPPDQDVYSVALAAGDTLSVALEGLNGTGVSFTLRDAGGVALAGGGGGATNVDRVMHDFLAPAAGTYYIGVSGLTGTNYSLTATVNAEFNTEPDNTLATARPFLSRQDAGTQYALGYVEAPSAGPTIRFGEIAAGILDNAVILGVTFDFKVGGVDSTDATFGVSTGPGAMTYVQPPIAEGNAAGILTMTLPAPTPVFGFGYAMSAGGAVTNAVVVQLFSGATLVGTFPVNTAVIPPFSFTEARFDYAGAPIDRVVLDFNEAAAARFVLDNVTIAPAASPADLYAVTLAEGAVIQASTATPADGTGEFVNALNPRLRLLNSSGAPVASDDNSGADGRNALLDYTVPAGAGGTYYVEVTASAATPIPTVGEYVLRFVGNTPTLPPFLVAATTPANNARLRIPPTSLTVDFNDVVLLSTLQASDLLVDGNPATGLTVVDGDTVTFTFPALTANGLHTFAIAAGALQDVQGTPISAFAASIEVDTIAPRVTATSVAPNAIIAPGSLTYTVTFSEAMLTSNILATGDFALAGTLRAVTYAPSSFSFNPAGTVLTLNYANLPDDRYTLTLTAGASGGTNFTDAVGNALDGEFTGTFPSGNGTAGGNFVIAFVMDLVTEAYATPLVAEGPAGGLVYDPSLTRTLAFSGDTDSFTLAVDPGQTISVMVTPTTAALRPIVELRDPSNAIIGTATATATGQRAIIQPAAAVGGTYTVTVRNFTAATLGVYTVQVFLNTALETEGLLAGATNNTTATAQDVNASFIALQSALTAASRGAVRGVTDALTYTAAAAPFAFEDIATTGTVIPISGDDAAASIPVGFTFSFYGVNYTNVGVSTNGLITFGGTDASFSNTDLTASPTLATLAAFWDDHWVGDAANSTVRYQVLGSGATTRLVVQWNNLSYLSDFPFAGGLTFQAVLGIDGSIRLNYQSLTTGNNFDFSDEGANATVGLKAAGAQGPNRVLVAFNPIPPHPLVGSGKSIVFAPPVSGPDHYSFTAAAGQTVSLALRGTTAGTYGIDLLNSAGTVIASGAGGATNVNRLLNGFPVPAAGTYYARVSGPGGAAYNLILERDAVFEGEANDTAATATAVVGQGALGAITVPTASVVVPSIYATTETGSGNGFPFHLAPFAVPSMRYQQIYAASQFASGGVIDVLRFRRSSGQGTFTSTTINATIRLSYAATSVATASGTFANNVGAGAVTVFSGPLVLASTSPNSTPQQFDIVIDIPNTFTYTPALGDLLLDVTVTNSPTAGFFAATPIGGPQNVTTRVFAPDAVATTGSVGAGGTDTSPYGLITRFDILAVPDEDWYGVTLPAGQTGLNVETRTPADGAGQFVNVLNPKIDLYDAAGTTLIASGVALADGRNEVLTASGLTAGATYKVRVRGESSTGEYYLGVKALREPTITVQVDNGDWGFRVTGGGWTSNPGGYGGDHLVYPLSGGGSATNVARWTMRPSSSVAEVFASWVARPTNATNATYRIYDGATLRGTVVVDQTRAPNDVLIGGATIAESLGVFAFATALLRVELVTLGANGDLSADAVFDPPAGSAERFEDVSEAVDEVFASTPAGSGGDDPAASLAIAGLEPLDGEAVAPAWDDEQAWSVVTAESDAPAFVADRAFALADLALALVTRKKGRPSGPFADPFFPEGDL